MGRGRFEKAASMVSVAVVSSIVTTVVLAGGYALAGTEVGQAIANNSVTSAKIADDAVRGIDIKNGTVATVDLAPAVAAQLGGPPPIDVKVRVTQAATTAGSVVGLPGAGCNSSNPNNLDCNMVMSGGGGVVVALQWVNTGVPVVLVWGGDAAGCGSASVCNLVPVADTMATLSVAVA